MIDPDLAVAHGGWQSTAHKRYDRFSTSKVLALPSAMLGETFVPAGTAEARVADDSLPPVMGAPAERPLPQPPSGGRLGAMRTAAGRGHHGSPPAPRAAPVPTPPVPSDGVVLPPPDPRPLTRANAVGRHVMVSRASYPLYDCAEFEGRGWRAVVIRLVVGGAAVEFLFARTALGRPYAPAELQLDALQPL